MDDQQKEKTVLSRRRDGMMDAVSMFFLEHGKIVYDRKEYDRIKRTPYRSSLILRHFTSWTRFIKLLKKNYPGVVEELEPKPDPIVVQKPDIQAQFAAAKAAVATELKDGKDI